MSQTLNLGARFALFRSRPPPLVPFPVPGSPPRPSNRNARTHPWPVNTSHNVASGRGRVVPGPRARPRAPPRDPAQPGQLAQPADAEGVGRGRTRRGTRPSLKWPAAPHTASTLPVHCPPACVCVRCGSFSIRATWPTTTQPDSVALRHAARRHQRQAGRHLAGATSAWLPSARPAASSAGKMKRKPCAPRPAREGQGRRVAEQGRESSPRPALVPEQTPSPSAFPTGSTSLRQACANRIYCTGTPRTPTWPGPAPPWDIVGHIVGPRLPRLSVATAMATACPRFEATSHGRPHSRLVRCLSTLGPTTNAHLIISF